MSGKQFQKRPNGYPEAFTSRSSANVCVALAWLSATLQPIEWTKKLWRITIGSSIGCAHLHQKKISRKSPLKRKTNENWLILGKAVFRPISPIISLVAYTSSFRISDFVPIIWSGKLDQWFSTLENGGPSKMNMNILATHLILSEFLGLFCLFN